MTLIRRVVVIGSLALASTVAASEVSSQGLRDLVVPDASSCAQCSISVRTKLRFSSREIAGEIFEPPFAVRSDPFGNFMVLSQNSLPRVYSERGIFLRSFGRSGEGPGELVQAEDLFWTPGDSLVILDGYSRRASVFTASGRFVRQLRTPSQLVNSVIIRWPESVLLSGQIASSQTAGFPLHLTAFDSSEVRLIRSFGPDRGILLPGGRGITFHVTSRGEQRRIVSARPEEFRIYSWSESGHLLSILRRTAPWFPDSGAGRIGSPKMPPTPALMAIAVDRAGLIWVFVRTPAESWRRAWAAVNEDVQEVRVSQLEYHWLFNTIVEVIDPSSGRVLSRSVLPGLAISAPLDGHVAVYGRNSRGEPELRIDSVRLERAKRE